MYSADISFLHWICGLPGHNTRTHDDRLPPSFLGVDDLTTESSFDSQATWVIDVLGLLFWNVVHVCLYKQALTDVRSTVARIKFLYCISSFWWWICHLIHVSHYYRWALIYLCFRSGAQQQECDVWLRIWQLGMRYAHNVPCKNRL